MATLQVTCPRCGAQGGVDASFAGRQIRCRCGTDFVVPAVSPAPGATPGPASGPTGSADTSPADWSVGLEVGGRFLVTEILGGPALCRVDDRVWETTLLVATASEGDEDGFTSVADRWVALGTHPNIQVAYYLHRLGGRARLVMEDPGPNSLADLPAAALASDPGRLCDLAIQSAWGLLALHDAGMVHGRVHAACLRVTGLDLVKLGDITFTLTPGEMAPAPEVAAGASPGPPADLWQWASVFHKLGGAAAPPALRELLDRCLAADPAQRPRDLREAVTGLQSIYKQARGDFYARPAPRTYAADTASNRGLALLAIGRPEEAAGSWEEAVRVAAGHLEATYHLALYQWRNGKIADDEVVRRLTPIVAASTDWMAPMLQGHVQAERLDRRSALLGYGEAERLGGGEAAAVARRRVAAIPADHGGHELAEHPHEVWSLGLTPDGSRVVTASGDSLLRVWDLASGEVTHELAGHQHSVRASALNADGRFAISGSWDGTARVWDITTGAAVRQLKGEAPIHSVALSADARYALSGGDDPVLRFWATQTAQVARSMEGHTDSIQAVALNADGRFALSAGRDGAVFLWDVAQARCLQTLSGHTGMVRAVALSGDGRVSVTAGEDRTLRLWDNATGVCARVFEGHQDAVDAVAIALAAGWIVSGGRDRTLRVWEVATGRCRRTIGGYLGGVLAVGLTPDARICVTGSAEKTLRTWDLSAFTGPDAISMSAPPAISRPERSQEAQRVQRQYRMLVEKAALAENPAAELNLLREARSLTGRSRATEARERWQRLSGSMVRSGLRDVWLGRVFDPPEQPCTGLAVREDDLWVLSGSPDGRPRLWEVASGRCLKPMDAHGSELTAVGLSPDGRWALAGSMEGSLRLWDVERGRTAHSYLGVTVPTRAACLSSDARWVLSGSDDGMVRVWDVAGGRLVRVQEGHVSPVQSVAWTADGRFMLSGDTGGTIRLWDAASGACRQVIDDQAGSVMALSCARDGIRALAAEHDGTITLLNLDDGSVIHRLQTERITKAALTPEGRWAVLATEAGEVVVWDLPTGSRLASVPCGPVGAFCLSPDGHYLLTAPPEGPISEWILDWDLELPPVEAWSDAARPYLAAFLRVHQPYAVYLAATRDVSDEELANALVRRPEPNWTSENYPELLATLARVGLGWLKSERTFHELESMTEAFGRAAGSGS